MVPHAEEHRKNDAEHRNVGGILADSPHFDQADFQSDQKQENQNREPRNDVDERIDIQVAQTLGRRKATGD